MSGLLRESAGAGESLESSPEIADFGVEERLGDREGAVGVAGDGILAESSGGIAVDGRIDGVEAFAMSIEEDDGDILAHQLMEERHGEMGVSHTDHPLQTEQRDLLNLAGRPMANHHPPVLQTRLFLPAIQVPASSPCQMLLDTVLKIHKISRKKLEFLGILGILEALAFSL